MTITINEDTMKIAHKTQSKKILENNSTQNIQALSQHSFKNIAPFWPLKNLIAVNPLQGFENMPIESAITLAATYFQQSELPEQMRAINRATIKWLQVYCDEGQATIRMPSRKEGLYAAWRPLAIHDAHLHNNDKQKQEWLHMLPQNAEQAIAQCLLRLGIAKEEREQFLTLMLTTLPGWAAHIKYRTEWAGFAVSSPYRITQVDYLALRLIITCLLWPHAKTLLQWYQQSIEHAQSIKSPLEHIQKLEDHYRLSLLEKLATQQLKAPRTPQAQLIFCIDVRSEPFRRAFEATGDYQTLGFAGFFGIPAQITDTVQNDSYASCPVLLTPKHEIKASPHHSRDHKGYARLSGFKRLYQSVKYSFTTPFALVETLGIASGAWMGLRSFFPRFASRLKNAATKTFYQPHALQPSIDSIPISAQYSYAESALKMMGLTHHFAPLVVFCGHGSTTQNNAYATALDCGACGGRHGDSNARILAAILNRVEVKTYLAAKGIIIPENTRFMAALHDTTTDAVTLYDDPLREATQKLKQDLEKARTTNSAARLKQMGECVKKSKAISLTWLRAQDWAQVRPEWGLARNAAFIVAPRNLTAGIDLDGRVFLHSYDWQQDHNGGLLATILTAPMVVAQWINSQYFFSTLDNVAYGSGSKVTKNITGKIGIMQGNASDLMHGLPLQSVYRSDTEFYHEALRLLTIVYAPRDLLDNIIPTQPILKRLFSNGWIHLVCLDPIDHRFYMLGRDLNWSNV